MSVLATVVAAAPDPTGGVFSTAQADLTTLIIPAAAGLVLVAVVFWVAVRWASRSLRAGVGRHSGGGGSGEGNTDGSGEWEIW